MAILSIYDMVSYDLFFENDFRLKIYLNLYERIFFDLIFFILDIKYFVFFKNFLIIKDEPLLQKKKMAKSKKIITLFEFDYNFFNYFFHKTETNFYLIKFFIKNEIWKSWTYSSCQ